jgi:hypothetical protein
MRHAQPKLIVLGYGAMHNAIEFDAIPSPRGWLRIPEKFRKLLPQTAKKLHVRILAEEIEQADDRIQYYLEHPLIVQDIKAPTRAELYQGR